MNSKIHASSFDEVIDKFFPESIKKTRQRVDILKVLCSASQPLSAAEIFDILGKSDEKEKYAFSTVYRNLLAFEKAGVVIKTVLSTEDNAVYELKRETHKHYAVCLNCHTKIPIKACPLHDIAGDIKESIPDFQVTGHQLEIYGYCTKCRQLMGQNS
ncbi:transcriptional repressor [Butyrivibrio sp. CB08]|uniref:Fur family transcriptional regulator n=1 Tax=Butyrivibrio sp. CB08 TaxID=2364879 RepID=UPI000EAACD16|nr:transcriptional repressor [Butyrivibrio sp. CB08]RKM58882.1 transcriptional repressor [Butyrivibrio sp. CB08]